MKALVCGYGNPFRTDDGVGHLLAPAVAEMISSLGGEAEVRLEHQLLPEMAEEFGEYDLLVFADARVPGTGSGDGYDIREISPDPALEGLNIHSVGPEWVLALAAAIGGSVPPAVLVSVEGDSFDFGEGLTAACSERMKNALSSFKDRLRTNYLK
ncbi:MAG: hydrogenase maturation protease [Synergistales bacterium]|nr:hydrogenase maturation protease [Synergistales bacterium]